MGQQALTLPGSDKVLLNQESPAFEQSGGAESRDTCTSYLGAGLFIFFFLQSFLSRGSH